MVHIKPIPESPRLTRCDSAGTKVAAEIAGADLTGCTLCGADLTGCDLRGATLKGCTLRGARLEQRRPASRAAASPRLGPRGPWTASTSSSPRWPGTRSGASTSARSRPCRTSTWAPRPTASTCRTSGRTSWPRSRRRGRRMAGRRRARPCRRCGGPRQRTGRRSRVAGPANPRRCRGRTSGRTVLRHRGPIH